MPFEGGKTFSAYYSVAVVWIYPVLVGVAYYGRRSPQPSSTTQDWRTGKAQRYHR
ncbi:MAG TPA: hypothetical protein VK789_26525 [Bryobacteraceae bacterium]|nr:hypothetical protein [Bryobacteraceae bacterium]